MRYFLQRLVDRLLSRTDRLPDDWTPQKQGRLELINLNRELDELRRRADRWEKDWALSDEEKHAAKIARARKTALENRKKAIKERGQCIAITKAGHRCTNPVSEYGPEFVCGHHWEQGHKHFGAKDEEHS